MSKITKIDIPSEVFVQQFQLQNWNEVIRIGRELISNDPDFEIAYGKLAIAYRKTNNIYQSDEVTRRAIAKFGMSESRLRTLGDTAMDNKNWPTAIGIWAELRCRYPNVPQGYYRAIKAYSAMGLLEEAEELGIKALNIFEERPSVELLITYSELLMKIENWTLARKLWQRVIDEYPDDPRGYSGIIHLIQQIGKLPENKTNKYLNLLGKGKWSENMTDKYLKAVEKTQHEVSQKIAAIKFCYDNNLISENSGRGAQLFKLSETDDRLKQILNGATIKQPLPRDNEPIRVIFYLPAVTQSDNVLPLYEAMHEHPKFKPIILCSRNANKANTDSFNFFFNKYPESKGHRIIDGGEHINQNISLYELQPHFVFYHTPYSHNDNFPFYLKAEFVSRHTYIGHINYGFFPLTMGAKNSHIYANDHVGCADLIFCENDFSKQTYLDHYPDDRLYTVGYPKFDEFIAHIDTDSPTVNTDKNEPLDVVWTPHWQLPEDPTGGTHTSNFLGFYKQMLELAKEPYLRLHVRPHPLVRSRLKTMELLDYEEFDAVMAAFEEAGAIVHPANSGASYIDILSQSAVLVSDFSSLIPEFAISRRPIIFCRTEQVWNNGKWIGSFGKELIENCCYQTSSFSELKVILKDIVVERNHPKLNQMNDFIEKHKLYLPGSACERILDSLNNFTKQHGS